MRVGVVVSASRVAAARASGVDYLESAVSGGLAVRDGDSWRLADAFRDARYPSFAVLFPGDLALSDPRVPLDPVWAYLDAVLPLVGSVAEPGARVVVGSGAARRIPLEVDRTAGEERFAEALRGTRDRAAALGLEVALEPLSAAETNLLHTVGEAVAFLDAHDLTDVRLTADLFHMMAAGEPVSVVADHAGRIAHAHVADRTRRPLGTGDAPWRGFLAALTTGGYAGAVSLECAWGEDVAGELTASVALLREALEGA